MAQLEPTSTGHHGLYAPRNVLVVSVPETAYIPVTYQMRRRPVTVVDQDTTAHGATGLDVWTMTVKLFCVVVENNNEHVQVIAVTVTTNRTAIAIHNGAATTVHGQHLDRARQPVALDSRNAPSMIATDMLSRLTERCAPTRLHSATGRNGAAVRLHAALG